jgi:hypothetical protein
MALFISLKNLTMKHFTNSLEFILRLKVGAKIAIIHHDIINDKIDDTQYEGIINEISDEYFTYTYKTNSAVITKTQWIQTEIEWKVSRAFLQNKVSFCSVYHCNSFGESSTILFNSASGCNTFALHPDAPSCCPTCKGTGMSYTTISTIGEKEKEISISYCYDCKGEAVDAEEGQAIQEHVEELKAMWCECDSEDAYYVPDRAGVKHHWNCGCCHKLKQVG